MKRTVFLFLSLIFFLSCTEQTKDNHEKTNQMNTSDKVNFPFQNPNLHMAERVDDLIDRMTIEEKANQLLMNTDGIPRLGIPPYDWWNESLHGVARNGRATVFPQAIGLAATFDTPLIHQMAETISDEARAKYNLSQKREQYGRYKGLTFWTPNVNIFRDPRWGRGQETYGEDPYLTGQIGLAYVQGLQGDNSEYLKAAALAKHYAVHNGPEGLRHEFDAVVSMKDMWETYLPAFETLVVDGKVEGVMGAYNKTNGFPCCAHPYLMKEILRDQWGFNGYYVTDCWALVDFYEGHNIVETVEEAAALALKEGSNINCGSTYNSILSALEKGLITEALIDQNLRQALPTRFKLGMFDPLGSTPWDDYGAEKIRADEHIELSREIAAKSMVLLKNENQLLPLDKNIDNIFVTGPMATHAQALLANYYGVSDNLVTFLEGIVGNAAAHSSVVYVQGALMDIPNRNPVDWATENAMTTDVTIACIGISQLIEGEEGESIASAHKGDRVDLKLPENQIEYLKTVREKAENLVVVVTAGSAVDLTEVYELADALIYAWYPGEQGGNGLADVVFGNVNPSGRLPVTLPKSVSDLPPFEDYSLKDRTYRYMNKEPMFPFGFGLSYSDFSYSNLSLSKKSISKNDEVEVSVTVTNNGEVLGEEVIQLYIKDNESSVTVPMYSLKEFKKIELANGASKQVSFTITKKDLEVVLESGERIVEPGRFTIFVGGSTPSKRCIDLGATQWVEEQLIVN